MADEAHDQAAPRDQTSPRDKLLLLLINGVREQTAIETAVVKLGVSREQAEALVAEAKAAIHSAADINRRNELGTAYTRLQDLYGKAAAMRDWRTALAAQRELNRLCRLYDDPGDSEAAEDAAAAAEELKAIADYLLPLELAPAQLPLSEHARIAAEKIRAAGAPTFPH